MSPSKVRLLCITDPSTHPPFDTTVEIYQRLSRHEGFELYHCNPYDLVQCDQVLARRVRPFDNFSYFQGLDALPNESRTYGFFDGVFCRCDTPFPEGYLEKLSKNEHLTNFINQPSGLLEADSRAFYRKIAGHRIPRHLATNEKNAASAFIKECGVVVAKNESSYGGKGIFKISLTDKGAELERGVSGEVRIYGTVEELVDCFLDEDALPVEFVRFLKNVTAGDKRILVIEDQILGAMLRCAPGSSWINNVSAGGTVSSAVVTDQERIVIAETAPEYTKRGIRTLGYDFLMDDDGSWVLSEINAGNVGGYGRVERLSGEPVMERLFGWIESSIRSRK